MYNRVGRRCKRMSPIPRCPGCEGELIVRKRVTKEYEGHPNICGQGNEFKRWFLTAYIDARPVYAFVCSVCHYKVRFSSLFFDEFENLSDRPDYVQKKIKQLEETAREIVRLDEANYKSCKY
jgi:hypothetical protein